MITKYPSKKQVIIPIYFLNTERIIVKLNKYIANINKALKNIKSNIIADFIYTDNKGMAITTNKVAANLDLETIEKYIKNIDEVDTMSEFKIVDSNYFTFTFLFSYLLFSFPFWDLGLELM